MPFASYLRVFVVLLLVTGPVLSESARDQALRIAREEWEFFGRQTIGADGEMLRSGAKQYEEGYWQRVEVYWKGVGRELTGKDTNAAWSAVFMSHVMRKAGLGSRFHYSPWHAHYIRRSIRARREKDEDFAFWGFRPGEIDVIGGNVSDSVTLKILRTDDRGQLVDQRYRWFVVMAPRF